MAIEKKRVNPLTVEPSTVRHEKKLRPNVVRYLPHWR